ncbi:sialate O-acetylesterase [Saccharicrinis fermentans]|uniref:sialate O-acetylesterase n=1 Tax=Saccharicrinis fermentans TaxID=982 RepID=UPI001268C795|nr:sialate O-acetylesterase [Saccharicrinis fermentans]
MSDHMVLQQKSNVALWGKDKPNVRIIVRSTWGKDAYSLSDMYGNWKVNIETIEAGGPYEIEIVGSERIVLHDVLLGEVWICSGQSNMKMPLIGNYGQPVFDSNLEILNSTNKNLRFFDVACTTSSVPLDDCEGEWKLSNPRTASKFSAVAYFYGKMLQSQLDVPIGLICSAWGGTPAQAWTPRYVIDEGFKEFENSIEDVKSYSSKTPTLLYNSMIHPLINYTIKGAIWYQGEANRSNPEQYLRLFPAMIESWRKAWRLGDFPFYFVQVAPLGWGDGQWPLIREAQLKSMLAVHNCGMVVTLDIGEPTCIHPPHKKAVGQRLALWALAKTYGYTELQYSGPVYRSMEIRGKEVFLNFDYAPNGVTSMYKELKYFEVAGLDNIYHPAEARIDKGQLKVWCDDVEEPVNVRYAWSDYVDGCLFNTAGLPASSFRTDSFGVK